MQKIGFLGPKGTFSQEALEVYAHNRRYEGVDFSTIPDMICAVEKGDIQEAVTPIENSLEGAVNATLDIMAFQADVKIKSELVIPVRQNLMVCTGTKAAEIRHILSHPQAVGQCRSYISTNFPDAEIRLVYSTAGAAQEVSRSGGGYAAIGSAAAAKVYGLDILDHSIQDCGNNLTRFVVLARQDSERTGCDKTSIVFSTEDKPGSLYSILDIFNLWDINLSRIESRPAKNQLGRYIFFVDIEGHREDQDVRDALTMVKRKSSFFKFLGSYPKYTVSTV